MIIIENTQNDGKVQIKLGTTTANTDFEIVKSDGTPVFNVDGAGGVSIPGSLTTGTHVDNTQIKDLIIELGNGRTVCPLPVFFLSPGTPVSFPGGKWDPTDASLEETAIREFKEELGIDVLGLSLACGSGLMVSM